MYNFSSKHIKRAFPLLTNAKPPSPTSSKTQAHRKQSMSQRLLSTINLHSSKNVALSLYGKTLRHRSAAQPGPHRPNTDILLSPPCFREQRIPPLFTTSSPHHRNQSNSPHRKRVQQKRRHNQPWTLSTSSIRQTKRPPPTPR